MPFLTVPNYQLIQIQRPLPLAELQISDLITNSRMKSSFYVVVLVFVFLIVVINNCQLTAEIPSDEYKLDAWKKNLAFVWKEL